MTHHLLNCAARMRARGLRVTPQRELILDAVCEGGGRNSIGGIYARLHARAPAISRATVYRALKTFCELGLVVAVDLGDGHTLYEIASVTPHHDLVCRACGKVEQLEHSTLHSLFARIERERRFTIQTNHLVLYGLCAQCRAGKTGKTR